METPKKKSSEKFIKDIRKNTRRIFTAEQKILIVMEGLRAETSVAELCRQHNIANLSFIPGTKNLWKPVKNDSTAMSLEKPRVMKCRI
ncbi:transposase [Chryseobacterium mulctrae]|uniref:transposase n=1 Tax=Chryseobacterium mulctrae TaxID=2576777 RepID=UPI0011175474|nr:transposase [Chryseobacterium mulctrae]